MKSMTRLAFGLIILILPSHLCFAATITSDFRDFKNPFLVTYSIGAAPQGNATMLGPVKITNSSASVVFFGGSYITGTPQDPANVGGWGTTSPWLPLILDIQTPVKAFGVTFDNTGSAAGSILAVYDGPNGTGQLIGQVESVRVPPRWSATNQPIDFVGVIDDHNRIRSAVLIAQGSDQIRIRAMALSIPEPSVTRLFAVLCIVGIVIRWPLRSSLA